MRRTPLIVSSICAALVVAWCLAAYSAHATSSRRRAVAVFHKSIDNEINSKYSTGVDVLLAAYGPADAARLIEAKSKTTDTIAFDGTSRFVKAVERTKEWTGPGQSRRGYSDGIVLKSFEHESSAVWDGPMGTRISGVRFVDGELVVSIHGNLDVGTSQHSISEDSPETYVIPWHKDSKPVPGTLYDSIIARHHKDG